jgi:hypothetical protein
VLVAGAGAVYVVLAPILVFHGVLVLMLGLLLELLLASAVLGCFVACFVALSTLSKKQLRSFR